MHTLINIDNGGTQTDICVIRGDRLFHGKALTTPYDLSECFLDVIKAGATEVFGEGDSSDEALERLLRETVHLRYSTTEGTNRVVQGDGPRLGLILTDQTDPQVLLQGRAAQEMFDTLVGNRVRHINPTKQGPELESQLVSNVNELLTLGATRLVVALAGDANARADEDRLFDIILERYPRHLLGAVPVLFSYNVANDSDDARRTWTALLNSFLHPGIERFLYEADRTLRQHHVRRPMLIYCNDGTSKRVAKTVALKTLDSGPRGGLDGARALVRHYGLERCVTLDIGGTTADISLVNPDFIPEQRRGYVRHIPISLPLPEVNSIGVAGSSVFSLTEDRQIQVGPQSVGSTPGPACFGRGGTSATMTDVNLLVGLLDPASYFDGKLTLDKNRAEQAVTQNIAEPLGISLNEALKRMGETFEETVADGIRGQFELSGDESLLAFGGAGPMNACGVARRLGIRRVIVPRLAAVFSAFGIGFSDITHLYERPLPKVTKAQLAQARETLLEDARRGMFAEGYELKDCRLDWSLEYDASDGRAVAIPLNGSGVPKGVPRDLTNTLVRLHASRPIPGSQLVRVNPKRETHLPKEAGQRSLLLGSREPTAVPVFQVDGLAPGATGRGPAVVEERFFTCYVPTDWSFVVDENRNLDVRDTA